MSWMLARLRNLFLRLLNVDVEAKADTRGEQRFIASVTAACPTCRAPGLYGTDNSLLTGVMLPDGTHVGPWPECYRPAWKGQHVGDKCPHCGTARVVKRKEDERSLGVIWSRKY